MSKIPIDECPAGPAMDAAVAEKMGWGYISSSTFGGWCWRYPDDITGRLYESPPAFSTDIAAAWGLWSRLCAEWYYAKLLFVKDLRVKANLYRNSETVARSNPTVTVIAKNGFLAICRAFLKANGVEFIEVPE